MYMNNREEEVQLLKDLCCKRPLTSPKCGEAILEHLHKKAKKSDCEWNCPACGESFRTIRMLKELPLE